ncbi:MAG: L-serine ammonia-lyase, iron-sulfur-dependent, subunit alpha [Thermotogota bacterium]|nr:L-serine ammonia-lyase, iron-sulfur-dependent, subunit alpha [Thermotogota bacterium]
MKKETMDNILKILQKEVVPALGCTEPIAVALAAAKAKETLGEETGKVHVFVSPNLFKNGMGVGIPGTGMVGLHIAAALGACGGESKFGLEVLKHVTTEHIKRAKEKLGREEIEIEIKKHSNPLFVECVCYNKDMTHETKVVIQEEHSNISLIERDDKILFKKEPGDLKNGNEKFDSKLDVETIIEFSKKVAIENLFFLKKAVQLNAAISEEGLIGDYGIRIGKTMMLRANNPDFGNCLSSYIVAMTAAAADARMAGCVLPAMSNSGSGNQGINATIPIYSYADKMHIPEEKMLRALAMSHLLAIHIKTYLGRLSALCGVVAASTGVSAGLTYLMGGSNEEIILSMKSLIANLTGMICDGAKPGCALKVASGVNAAYLAAKLAVEGNGASENDGIIEIDIENTIKNLANIGSKAMKITDEYILNIMVCK